MIIPFNLTEQSKKNQIMEALGGTQSALEELAVLMRATGDQPGPRQGLFGHHQNQSNAIMIDFAPLLRNQKSLKNVKLGSKFWWYLDRTNDKTCVALSQSLNINSLELLFTSQNKLPSITNSGFTYLSKIKGIRKLEIGGINDCPP